MRWSGQQVLDDGVGSELALPGLRGLLRSVRVPEFAGTTFHEIEARSVLNRVPGDSPVPFRWTVNPYRGCGHACVYCLDGATPVLMADGRTRPISDLRVGDSVVGTAPAAAGAGPLAAGGRRYVRTTVLAHWSTTKPVHRVRLADGTHIVASGEHRFLTGRGWRHVAPGWCRSGRRPRLRVGDTLCGPGTLPVPRAHSASYREGYLHGLVRADAGAHVAGSAVRDGRIDLSFPSDRIELEALGRAHHFLAASAEAARLVAAGGGRVSHLRGVPAGVPVGAATPGAGTPESGRIGVTAVVDAFLQRPRDPDDDWCAGFLAGVADAAGHVGADPALAPGPGARPAGRAGGRGTDRGGHDGALSDGALSDGALSDGALSDGALRLAVPDDELLGAAAGALLGILLRFTGWFHATQPEMYALVGMGAVVAATTGAPITGILLVFEMTNDYEIVLPLMLATVVANLVARRLEPDSLYSGWLRRRGERLQHGADRDVMAGLRVADAYDRAAAVVADSASLDLLLAHLGRGAYTDLPVVDEEHRLVGIITLADLGRLAGSRDVSPDLVAADVATEGESVTPGDSLLEAVRRMGIRGTPSLPVVDPATGRLLGVVGRAHVLALYERAVVGTGDHRTFP
jgi:CBS domain-containing protein